MIPRDATDAEVAYWETKDEDMVYHRVVIGGPQEAPDVIPCPAIVAAAYLTYGVERLVRVAYQLDEIEVAALARGGTLWLTTWGGLPIHLVEVVAAPSDRSTIDNGTAPDGVPIGPADRDVAHDV